MYVHSVHRTCFDTNGASCKIFELNVKCTLGWVQVSFFSFYRYGIILKVKSGGNICECAMLLTVAQTSQQKPYICKMKPKSQWTQVLTNLGFYVVVICDSVDIVTKPQAVQSGVWFTAGVGYFHSLSDTSKPAPAPIYFPIQCLLHVPFSGDKTVGAWCRPLTSSNAVPCMPSYYELGQPWLLLGWRTRLFDFWAISRRFSFTRFSHPRRVRWLQMWTVWRHAIRPEDGGSRLLCIVGSHLPDYTTLHKNMVILMIWYLFTAVGFLPGGTVRWTCTKIGKRQLYTEGDTIHKTVPKHRIHKMENKHTGQKQTHEEY